MMQSPNAFKRLAGILTEYTPLSDAQQILERFLVGYPVEGRWHHPPLRIVSMYVRRQPEGDLGASKASEFGFSLFPTIAEALRCGGDRLAVDGVLLLANQGEYPRDELGLTQFPRALFFRECVRVFEEEGCFVPVFVSQRLSHRFQEAQAMVQEARRLGFPLMAGSALPLTWRLPEIPWPPERPVREALMVGVGDPESALASMLEVLQSMQERRQGEDAGIASVQCLEGDAVWRALDEGRFSRDLLEAALSRSDTPRGLSEQDGRPQDLLGSGELFRLASHPLMVQVTYANGTQASALLVNGAIKDFCFAAELADGESISAQFFLPPPNFGHTARLAVEIERLFVERRTSVPIERALLAGGTLEAAWRSRAQGGARLETPHLRV